MEAIHGDNEKLITFLPRHFNTAQNNKREISINGMQHAHFRRESDI